MTQAAYLRFISVLLGGLILSGCQQMIRCADVYSCKSDDFVAPKAGPKAKLTIKVQSDSTNTTLAITRGYAYSGLDCGPNPNGNFIEQRAYVPGESFDTIDIPANKPFTFALFHNEARPGHNRMCSYTAEFFPQVGGIYDATLAMTGDLRTCDMSIVDKTTGGRVSFATPVLSCAYVVKGVRPANGVPVK